MVPNAGGPKSKVNSGYKSVGLNFFLTTAGTAIYCHQFALSYVKLFILIHRPFMVAVATQYLALVLFLE